MQFAELIRRTRQKAFLSQEAFADILGISVSTINRWENGKCRPSLSALKSIKEFCDEKAIPYDELESAWLNANESIEE